MIDQQALVLEHPQGGHHRLVVDFWFYRQRGHPGHRPDCGVCHLCRNQHGEHLLDLQPVWHQDLFGQESLAGSAEKHWKESINSFTGHGFRMPEHHQKPVTSRGV